MARIALIIGFAAAGALTGGLAWAGFLGFGIAGSALGAIASGAAVGLMAGQLAAAVIFPGHTYATGPRLQDTQISSSANGSPIPIIYGSCRLGGQIIWSTGILETKTTQTTSGKGAPSQTASTYSYTTSFAAVFCEGPANILQIWGDAKLIYDTTGKGAISSDKLATGIGSNTAIVVPAIYPGSSTQQPDPTIQAARGISATPAYRYRCYIVYENFPLADFGNRLPNIRALCVSSTVQAYIKDTYPGSGIVDTTAGTPAVYPPQYPYISPFSRRAVLLDTPLGVLENIDLNTSNTTALPSWAAGTAHLVGDQILDPNGNVQVVYQITGAGTTGSTVPAFDHTEGNVTVDNQVHWQNVGAGPNGIPITSKGLINPPGTTNTSPHAAGVDTQGFVWRTFLITAGGLTLYNASKIDPNAFTIVGNIPLNPTPGQGGFVESFAFQSLNGQNRVVAVTVQNVVDGGRIYFIDGAAATLICSGATNGFSPGGFGQIALDNLGRAYVCWAQGTSSPWNYQINIYDPRGVEGPNVQTQAYFFNGDATHGMPRSLVWNAADNSLLGFTDLGAVVKIDVATMTIIGTTVPNFFTPNFSPDLIGKSYNGQVPPNGLMVLPGGSAAGVNANTHFITLNATTLADQGRVAQSNWFALSSNWHGISFLAYDIVTHSIIVGSQGGTAYSQQAYRLYLDRQTVGGSTLDQVVLDLLKRGNLDPSLVDATALAGDIVFGYPMTRNTDVKNALTPLAAAYFFDIIERDFKLWCVKRGGASAISIPEADLGLISDGFEVKPTFAQESDLPKSVEVMYSDPALDYQSQKQGKRRHARVVKTKNKTILELPLTLNSDVAMSIAVKALQVFWDERDTYTFNLYSAKYQIIDPSDVVTFTYRGKAYAARIMKTTSGQDFSLQIEAVSEDPRNYVTAQKGSGAGSYVAATLNPPPGTTLFLLDVPLLQDVDSSPIGSTGFYYAMSAPSLGWPGGALFASPDDEAYAQIGYSNVELPYGIALTAMPAPARSPFTFDLTRVLNVRMVNGTLASVSNSQFLNGANGFLLGSEVLQFKNATLLADGSYNLDTFTRGNRGTEWAVGAHTAGETFIFLGAGGLARVVAPTNITNANRYYKGVTIGGSVPGTPTQTMNLKGVDLKPYAPCHVTGTRDGSNNLTINWIRRTRVGGDGLLDGIDVVPLGEDSEHYEIDILVSGVVKRTIVSLTSPTATYSAAFQTADGITPGNPVTMNIYQISAQIGRGTAASVTL